MQLTQCGADFIEAIMLTMHNEQLTTSSTSLYLKDLQQVIHRLDKDYCRALVRKYLNKLAIRAIELFLRHACLVRPSNAGVRQRLLNDSVYLEDVALVPLNTN